MDRLLSMKVFERVASEGGFAAAARALDLSPPVVTRLVADLEQHLGARLLQRSTRRLSLTDAGQAYLSRVRHILQDIEEADAVTRSHTSALDGVLRLHAPPVLATYVIAPLLAEFRQRHPQIHVDLQVDAAIDPPIEDHDITLLFTDDAFDANVVARRVVESDTILVAAPSYLQRHGHPSTPEALSQHAALRLKVPFLSTRAWRLQHPELPPVEVPVQPVLVANHTDTLLRATLDGAGIAMAAIGLVAPYLLQGQLVRVLAPWSTGRLTIHAALPSRKFIPQRTQVFLDFLVEQTRRHAAEALAGCSEYQK